MLEWYLIAAGLLIGVAVVASVVERLPLTVSLVYLVAGMALGPWGTGTVDIDVAADAGVLRMLAEAAVLVSLFAAGLRMRMPLRDRAWLPGLRLATVSMVLTVLMVAGLGHLLMGLTAGAAILLGAILAPTDPVLAGQVQVRDPWDDDDLRRTLTSEAGLNDGTAFPFVMLGLGLLGLHGLGDGWVRWWAADVAWASLGGLAVGWAVGTGVARLVVIVRTRTGHGVGLDEFLALGIVAAAAGLALLTQTYGFLAVFAAGVAVRAVERRDLGDEPPGEARLPGPDAEIDERQAPAYLAHRVMLHSDRLERLAELGMVMVVGALLARVRPDPATVVLAVAVLVVVRPVAVFAGAIGPGGVTEHRRLVAWFGLRGIGSLFYLFYAVQEGVDPGVWSPLLDAGLTVIVLSIVVHGVSVTPLMRRRARRRREPQPVAFP